MFSKQFVFSIFVEILKEKKKTAKDLSTSVNVTKKEMDEVKEKLSQKAADRESQGESLDPDGHVVMDEEEYELVVELKNLKARYRNDYQELQHTKSEIAYCEKLVSQCRQRLVNEFDIWYSDSFLGLGEQLNSLAKGVKKVNLGGETDIPEDEQEKFDRLQMELLMENPDSVPYYNAKMQTERRQHTFAGGRSPLRRRKPGEVVPTVRNRPPTTLTVN